MSNPIYKGLPPIERRLDGSLPGMPRRRENE